MLRSFILVISLVFSQCSYGQNKEWTEDQRLLAGILAGEMLLDWHTTRNLAASNWCYQPSTRDHTCWELNPILGTYPSVNRIDNHFLVAGLVIYVLADMLPEYRTQLLSTLVVTEGLAAGNNVIRFGFKW